MKTSQEPANTFLPDKREQMKKYMLDQSENSTQPLSLLNQMFGAPVKELVQFLLDPSDTGMQAKVIV